MILKTVITTLDALAIIIFAAIGISGLKSKDGTHNVSFALALFTAINAFMIWY